MTPKSAGKTGSRGSEGDSVLTPAQFHILVTLGNGERHGYGIMQDVKERTGGEEELGPGSLYRSLRQLLDRGLIEEADPVTAPPSDSGPPRRSYRLTARGKATATEEARRLRVLSQWADEALGLTGGRP